VGALATACGQEDKPRFETARVDRADIVSRVTATGALSALVTVQVGAQVTGRVKEIHADFNSKVKKGELIAVLDAASYEAAVAEARANLAAAEANRERAETLAEEAARQEQRLKGLSEKDLVSKAEHETAVAGAKSARAEVAASKGAVEQARAALERSLTNLGYTRIYAPIDGVVLSRAVDVGQTVAASLQAPTLFTIAGDLKRMQVEASVSEADIGRVAEGLPASFTVDAYPGERFSGTIRQVRSAPQTVQNVVSYGVIVDVANDDGRLKPGMTANVTFVVEERKDALRVPNAALRYRPPEPDGREGKKPKPSASADGRPVFLLVDAAPREVRIQAGLSDGSFTEVLGGELREGDTVITASTEPATRSGSPGFMPGAPRGR
jgi:HlyD family secretion protein